MPTRDLKAATRRHYAHFSSPWLGYTVALALVLACGAARIAIVSPHSQALPFLFFYPAIALAAFAFGAGPGSTVLAGALLFGAFVFPTFPTLASWISLAVIGGLLANGCARIRNLRDRSAAIGEESRRLRFIIDRVSDWIFLIDESGNVNWTNQAACCGLGYAEEEIIGRPFADFDSEPRGSRVRTLLAGSLDGAATGEMVLKRRDGSLASVEISCTEISTGAAVVIHVAARDITERRQVELKLREARQWESLGSLTGGLAHDFNNLLTAMMGNASLAREMLPPGDRALPLLEAVEGAGERSAELIRLMLATAGYRPRNLAALRVDDLARQIAADQALPRGVKIDVQSEDCEIVSDRNAIETLLRGIIHNAAESYGAEPGEVRVRIGQGRAPNPAEASFVEGDLRDEKYVGIVVEDQGCGMTRDVLERAFNPFFTTKFTGRGLGLPAVRGIVRAHAGLLWIQTKPGSGTRVEVWLPATGYHQDALARASV